MEQRHSILLTPLPAAGWLAFLFDALFFLIVALQSQRHWGDG